MCSIRIALLQMTAHGTDLAANLAKGDSFCRRAAAMGVDIALFPEMWNIGYTPCPSDAEGRAAWHVLALTQQSEYVTRFRELAHELDKAVALTYLERHGEALRNSLSLIDRRGEILFTYSKFTRASSTGKRNSNPATISTSPCSTRKRGRSRSVR